MTRKPGTGREPVVLRRAIASLLRLAGIDLRDARSLTTRGSLRNAAMLQRSAVAHLVEAVVASEQGWQGGPAEMDVGSLDGDNPVKLRLEALQASAAGAADKSQLRRPTGSSTASSQACVKDRANLASSAQPGVGGAHH